MVLFTSPKVNLGRDGRFLAVINVTSAAVDSVIASLAVAVQGLLLSHVRDLLVANALPLKP